MNERMRQGKSGELRVASELIRQGLDVYSPLVDDQAIDLIVRVPAAGGVRHFDIQIKSVAGYNRVIGVRLPRERLDEYILILHFRHSNRDDEFFYLTGEQAARHHLPDSPFGDLVFNKPERQAYGAQTLAALAEFLRSHLPASSPREIELSARRFVASELGDAIQVATPVPDGPDWRVDLTGADGERVGAVVLNRHGVVIPERSATYESVRGLTNDPAVSAA